MDKSAVLGILDSFRLALEKQGILKPRIILFGSYAKGCAREDSDIDVVVVSKHFESKSYWDRIGILSEAICDVFKPIEAVAFTPEEWEKGDSNIVIFAREGEVIFG